MANEPTHRDKDKWDKWKIVLSPLGGFLTAVAVGWLTYITSTRLGQWQEAESKTRLYTELMSQREDAETSLRKEMFKSILDAFLNKTDSKSLEPEVLKLELLAYNFHESLNLAPLFKHLERELERRISSGKDLTENQQYLARLRKVARDIITKQMAVLEDCTNYLRFTVEFNGSLDAPSYWPTNVVTVLVENTLRQITVAVTTNDLQTQQLKVSLTVRTLNDHQLAGGHLNEQEDTDAEFWVGSFEFPMIDNTRLSHDQRCAVVLNEYWTDPITNASITVVCFPGSRAALREKPYYGEIIDKLQQARFE